MSIELCKELGIKASDIVIDRVADPSLPVSVGGVALRGKVITTHTGDGLVVVEVEDGTSFQFEPSATPFSHTATDQDGKPICPDC